MKSRALSLIKWTSLICLKLRGKAASKDTPGMITNTRLQGSKQIEISGLNYVKYTI